VSGVRVTPGSYVYRAEAAPEASADETVQGSDRQRQTTRLRRRMVANRPQQERRPWGPPSVSDGKEPALDPAQLPWG